MKFAIILLAVGINPDLYLSISEKPIELYDRYNRLIEEFPKYDALLFKQRPDSYKNFIDFLDNYKEENERIVVRIDKAFLGIYPSGQKPALFMRAK